MVYRRGLVEACVGGILAALSVVMTMAKLAFPFLMLPYLKFELAEIPVVIAAASLPPRVSLYASLAYWFVLLLVGEWTPIGPTMKFLAVISTVAGVLAASAIVRRRGRLWALLCFALSSLIRTGVMTLANYAVLLFVMPGFLEYASQLLHASGIGVGGEGVLLVVLALTALYNVLHVAMDLAVSLPISRALERTSVYRSIALGGRDEERGGAPSSG